MTTTSDRPASPTCNPEAGSPKHLRRDPDRSSVWSRLGYAPAVVLIAAGIIFRVIVLTGPTATVSSDEAIAGLLARHIVHGDFRAFFWGQAYGGTLDAWLLAPFTALAPGSSLALRASTVIESTLLALLIWRILLRTVAKPRAAFAAAAAWSFPLFSVIFGSRAELFYTPIIVLGLGLILLGIRFVEDPGDWRNKLLWGVVAGAGWWLGPTISIFALSIAVWVVWRARAGVIRALLFVVPGFIIGAFPWIWANIGSDFLSLENQKRLGTIGQHLHTFFVGGTPQMLGLQFNGKWVFPEIVSLVLVGVLVAILLIQSGLLLLRGNPLPLTLIFGPIVIIFGIAQLTAATGRYFYYLMPIVAAVVGAAFHPRIQVLMVALVLSLAAVSIHQGNLMTQGLITTLTHAGQTDQENKQLVTALERLHITRLFGDYWLAFSNDYIADERIIIVPFDYIRSRQYRSEVASSARPSYLFSKGNPRATWLQQRLRHRAIPYSTHEVAGSIVITPDEHVLPGQLGITAGMLANDYPAAALPPP